MENNLRKLRKDRKMKMEQVMKLAGCSISTLTKLENGERNLSNEWVAKFSKIFEVMPYELSDDPDYVFKKDNLEKMIKPKDDEQEQVGTIAQGTNENEILRIFSKLSVKGQVEVLTFAYRTEENEATLQGRDIS